MRHTFEQKIEIIAMQIAHLIVLNRYILTFLSQGILEKKEKCDVKHRVNNQRNLAYF